MSNFHLVTTATTARSISGSPQVRLRKVCCYIVVVIMLLLAITADESTAAIRKGSSPLQSLMAEHDVDFEVQAVIFHSGFHTVALALTRMELV